MYRKILTYGRILVALDGSEESYRALEHAVAISEKFGSELRLLAVVPKMTMPPSTYRESGTGFGQTTTTDVDMAENRERMWNLYRNVLTEAEHRVRSEHPELRMEKALREGRPSSTIVEEAENDGVDLIVMGSRGIGGSTGPVPGSTSRGVINSSTKSVLIVK